MFEPVPEYTPEEIKRIRAKSNMTQAGFANYLGVTVKAVEAWECGRNKPNGAARRLMSVAVKYGFVRDLIAAEVRASQ